MEVRSLFGATNPEGDTWIVIEQEGKNLFAIAGAVSNVGGRRFRCSGTHSPEVAIKASIAWADLLNISRLYVRV